MELEKTELGVPFVDDALSIRRHLCGDLSVTGQHGARHRVVPVFTVFDSTVEDGLARGVVHRGASSTQKGACLTVTRPRPHLGSIKEPNGDVHDNDGEGGTFAQDFEKRVVNLGWLRRERRTSQFGARHEPFVIKWRPSGDHRIWKVRAAMRSHGVIYT